jgi:hypothetical protein
VPGQAITPPSIATQPQSQTVTAGANVSFNVAAAGTAPLNYQWRFGSANLAGQTSSTLTLNGVTTGQAGNYSVVVSNPGGAVTSSVAVLTVNPAIVAPTITAQPQNQSILAGGSATFSVTATGTAPLSYQWRFGNAAIPGQTSAGLVLSNVSSNDAGNYSVIVTNAAGAITSGVATLTITPAAVAPFISSQPQSQTVVAGNTAIFSASAGGTAPLAYQWWFGSAALSGQTGMSLSLSAVTTNQSGDYYLVVTNAVGAVTSAPAILTVNSALVAPTILTQPQNKTVPAGSNVVFTVTATGSNPLQYQWRLNGSALAGQTSATLTLNNVTTNQSGGYSVVVSNPAGVVTSQVAQLTILQSRPPGDPSWPDYAGLYSGLFYDTNGVVLGGSGFFSFVLSKRGSYSASLQLSGGWRLSGTGTLDVDGRATNVFPRRGSTPLTVIWALDLNGTDQIAGLASSDIWMAELLGDRARFDSRTNPCPYAGKYTFILPGTPGAGTSPEGDSFGSVTINPNGTVSMKGFLADQSSALQNVRISKNGDWPLFAPLYSKIGALVGWIHLENRTTDDFHGTVSWMKPVVPTAACYPQGFSTINQMTGSFYRVPSNSTGQLLNWNSGTASITGIMLPQSYSVPVQFGSNSKLASQSLDLLSAAFVSTSGSFTGKFQPAGASQPLAFRGAVLQKANIASGFFIRSNMSGRVGFE